MTPNSVSSLLRSSTWQILPISGKQKNISCFLTSGACCPVVVVEQQQGPNQDPKCQHLTVQITDCSFLFWLRKGRLNGAWMLPFHYSVRIPNWSNPTLSLQHFKNKSPTFLPSHSSHASLLQKIKSWSELSDSTTFTSPVDAQQFGSWNSISSSSGGGTAMGKISCMALSSTRPCSTPLASKPQKLGMKRWCLASCYLRLIDLRSLFERLNSRIKDLQNWTHLSFLATGLSEPSNPFRQATCCEANSTS